MSPPKPPPVTKHACTFAVRNLSGTHVSTDELSKSRQSLIRQGIPQSDLDVCILYAHDPQTPHHLQTMGGLPLDDLSIHPRWRRACH